MRHPLAYGAAWSVAMMLAAACDGRPSAPTAPALEIRTPPSPMESFFIREAPATSMTVGEVVKDRIKSSDSPCTLIDNRWLVPCRHFLVTASRAGTLVATVTWDPLAIDMILLIRMGDTDFRPYASPWVPVVGRMTVEAGQQVRVMVGLAGTGEFNLDGPFSLTTSIE